MSTVLVVEDERDIRDLLHRYLERVGLQTITAATGTEGLRLLAEASPDLVLLDLGLPDIDGSEVLAAAAPTIPVIVLTARATVDDRISGLRMGADDYVVKPFSPTEVVLRVQAVLARRPRGSHRDDPLSFGRGRLTIQDSVHEAYLSGQRLSLTPSEWSLLIALASSPHRVLSRRELVDRISGCSYVGYERVIDSHVKNLRHKLHDEHHVLVETVIGFGYRFGLDRDG